MIWGLTLEPGCMYTSTVSAQTHLSLATLDCRGKVFAGTDPVKVSHVVLKTESCEQLVCSLVQGLVLQQQLNLQLMPNEEVAFSNQGNCCVYITGYSVDGEDYKMEEDGLSLSAEEENQTSTYDNTTGWVEEDILENGETTPDTVDEADSQPEMTDAAYTSIKEEPEEIVQSDQRLGTLSQLAPQSQEGSQTSLNAVPPCRESPLVDDQSQQGTPEVVCIAVKDEPGHIGQLDEEYRASSQPSLATGSQAESSFVKGTVTDPVEISTLEPEGPSRLVCSSDRGNNFDNQNPVKETDGSFIQGQRHQYVEANAKRPNVIKEQSDQEWEHYIRAMLPYSQTASQRARSDVRRNRRILSHGTGFPTRNSQGRITDTEVQYVESEGRLDQVENSTDNNELQASGMGQRSNSHARFLGQPVQGDDRGNRFQCRYCRKSLNCRRSLVNHEMIHTGDKPYTCRFCHKSFIQKSQWKVHERIHMGIKPFVCAYCGKAFSRRYNERMHRCVGKKRKIEY